MEAFAKGHDFSRAVKGRQFRGLQPLNRVSAAAQLPDSRGALCAPAGGPSPPLRCCVAGAQLCRRRGESALEALGIENLRAAIDAGQVVKIVSFLWHGHPGRVFRRSIGADMTPRHSNPSQLR